jgi:hypothetical protein
MRLKKDIKRGFLHHEMKQKQVLMDTGVHSSKVLMTQKVLVLG